MKEEYVIPKQMRTTAKILLSLSASILQMLALGQAPGIQWQRSLGGDNADVAHAIRQTPDGGFIAVGATGSNNGDVSGNHGGEDFWVVKLNSVGGIEWQKCLGGSVNDHAYDVDFSNDGGYIVAGYSGSNDGDVTGNNGQVDYWIVKLTSSGAIVWQKNLGGGNWGGYETAYAVRSVAGGYLIAGQAESNDGDVIGNHGASEVWVVKLNESGGLVSQKCFGGSAMDGAYAMTTTSDGGYITAGYTWSDNGDVNGLHDLGDGWEDIWVVKVNSAGVLQWQKCMGSYQQDRGYSIRQTTDGGYVVAAWVESNGADVTGHHGDKDMWVVRLNSGGGIVWSSCLGGSDEEQTYSVRELSDGGFVVAGSTASTNGDVTGNHGTRDMWVVRLSASGSIVWQKCLGGVGWDFAFSMDLTSDGGYVLAGQSTSNDGDVSGNHGSTDMWVVKLGPDVVGINENHDVQVSLGPNPTNGMTTLKLHDEVRGGQVVLTDMLGQEILRTGIYGTTVNLSLEGVAPGSYFCGVLGRSGQVVARLPLVKE